MVCVFVPAAVIKGRQLIARPAHHQRVMQARQRLGNHHSPPRPQALVDLFQEPQELRSGLRPRVLQIEQWNSDKGEPVAFHRLRSAYGRDHKGIRSLFLRYSDGCASVPSCFKVQYFFTSSAAIPPLTSSGCHAASQ